MSKKLEVFKVDWIGSKGNEVYSKMFDSYDSAIKFSKSVKDSIVFRLIKSSEKAFQWQIVPTVNGQNLLKAVNMRRELDKKGALINRKGISSVGMRTVPEFQKSQKARLISMVAVPAICGYAVYKVEDLPLWLKGALVAIGVGTLYVNGRNYISNVKHNKTIKKQSK